MPMEPSLEMPNVSMSIRLLLLLGSCLPILGAVLIAPLLPVIQAHFFQVQHVAVLVPVMLTLPALMIGLLGPVMGGVVDRYGRRSLLLLALQVYGFAGSAPLWLNDLWLILASRMVLGVAEAAIITSCTALISDYFTGAPRERMLALQTVASSVSAALFFVVGGAMGEAGWRAPFYLYLSGFVLFAWAAWSLWEPARPAGQPGAVAVQGVFPWRQYGLMFGLTWCAAVLMFVVAVQLGYLLNAIGVQAPGMIGAAIGLSHVAVLAGAMVTRKARRLGVMGVLVVAFSLAGGSLVWLAGSTRYEGVLVPVLVNGFAVGLMIPTLASSVLESLPASLRGRGAGGFMASFYLGEFASPLVVAILTGVSGSLAVSVMWLGMASLLLALLCARQAWAMRRTLPVRVL